MSLSFEYTQLNTRRTGQFSDLLGERGALVEFYTTLCSRCPAALEKLDNSSAKLLQAGVTPVAVNLDDIIGAEKILENISEFFSDRVRWIAVSQETRTRLKAELGMRSVPFAVYVGSNGRIVAMGQPDTTIGIALDATRPRMWSDIQDDESEDECVDGACAMKR